MPFGAGPRLCPGRYLALLEMKMAIAMLLGGFAIDRVGTRDGTPAQELFAFAMGPVGLEMKLAPDRRPDPPECCEAQAMPGFAPASHRHAPRRHGGSGARNHVVGPTTAQFDADERLNCLPNSARAIASRVRCRRLPRAPGRSRGGLRTPRAARPCRRRRRMHDTAGRRQGAGNTPSSWRRAARRNFSRNVDGPSVEVDAAECLSGRRFQAMGM